MSFAVLRVAAVTAARVEVGASVAAPVVTAVRTVTTSQKKNKTTLVARDKHEKNRIRKERNGGVTAKDIYGEVKLKAWTKWPRPLLIESETMPYIEPAPQLVIARQWPPKFEKPPF